jgi:dTDP-4-amino-4,6-dideoxygalactose transaminase
MKIQQKVIKNKIRLIPRYNWDYQLSDVIKVFKVILKQQAVLNGVKIKNFFGLKPIFTNSGRTSLYVILKSLKLQKGSYVGVPFFCCSVVFDAIKEAGFIPKFIDIELDDYNLSVADLDNKKKYLSAVVAVHMFGNPCNMDLISGVCPDIPIIEDCAQSLLSKYRKIYTGFYSKSTASFFSFRSGKYASTGEGSTIFCRDPILYESIKKNANNLEDWSFIQEVLHCLATYIKTRLYNRPLYGVLGQPLGMLLDKKLNLTNKRGLSLKKISRGDLGILNDRLSTLFSKVNIQRENALFYLKKIKKTNIFLPFEKDNCFNNYYQFAVRFENREQRDFVAEYLKKCGIDSAKYHDEIIDEVREQYDYEGGCPNAELCSKTTLVIPHYYTLSASDLDYIVDTINNIPDLR